MPNQPPRYGTTTATPEEPTSKYRVTVSIAAVERGKDGERVVSEILKVSASENEIGDAVVKAIRILDLQNPS